MARVGFIYDPLYLLHDKEGHPENGKRLETILEYLKKSGMEKEVSLLKPRKAKLEEVLLNHDRGYVYEVMEFSNGGGGYLDPDTYVNSHSYEVALYAVGGVLRGIELLLEDRFDYVFCAVRPPGHHAEFSRAMGFCLFNNVAVGCHYLLKRGFKRVMVIDFDAHHGNGTQRSFYETSRVLYLSTHQYPFYPGTGSKEERGFGEGEGYTFNFPMPAYSGDKEFLKVYEEELPKIYGNYKPEFLMVSAGYDLHEEDPLTQLMVSTEGIRRIVKSIVEVSKGVKALFALEGGYNLRALGESVLKTLEVLLDA